jgi:hypothetical protein
VQVSDIRDTAFFVSWVSDQPEVGAVRWSAAGSTPTTRVADVRGDIASTVHLVKVTGHNSSTAYVFDVVSGATVVDQGGNTLALRKVQRYRSPSPSQSTVVSSTAGMGPRATS